MFSPQSISLKCLSYPALAQSAFVSLPPVEGSYRFGGEVVTGSGVLLWLARPCLSACFLAFLPLRKPASVEQGDARWRLVTLTSGSVSPLPPSRPFYPSMSGVRRRLRGFPLSIVFGVLHLSVFQPSSRAYHLPLCGAIN